MAPGNIRQQYSHAMASAGFGHAVPIPVSSNEMRIGQCGYFDDTETWNPIVQITDAKEVAAGGFVAMDPTALKNLKISRTEAEWGPITTDAVTASDPKLDIGAAVPGVPVEASIEFEVNNESSFGAVLTTEKPVIRESYLRCEGPWKDWIKQNSKMLLNKHGSEIGRYKLWIITQVYMTRTARINVLQSSKRKVSIGFKADVAQVGKLEPHGGWSTDRKNDGWSEYTSKVRFWNLEAPTCVTSEAKIPLGTQEGEQRIVFITGFYYGFNVFTRSIGGRRLPQMQAPPKNMPLITKKFEQYEGSAWSACKRRVRQIVDKLIFQPREMQIDLWQSATMSVMNTMFFLFQLPNINRHAIVNHHKSSKPLRSEGQLQAGCQVTQAINKLRAVRACLREDPIPDLLFNAATCEREGKSLLESVRPTPIKAVRIWSQPSVCRGTIRSLLAEENLANQSARVPNLLDFFCEKNQSKTAPTSQQASITMSRGEEGASHAASAKVDPGSKHQHRAAHPA
ncbi:hypothetical protein SVAN01_04934 [Stagonosporopsis vannaccii]|nr:hypothetical protein SVAN01_04934 [Stagonosporopsis vannaccii]